MQFHTFSSYWTSTETYDALKAYMNMDFDGLRSDIVHMLGGGHVRANTFSFQNDMRNFNTKDDVLTLLVHLGYLAYDAERKEAYIPNKEITREFENAEALDQAHTEVSSILTYNDENSVGCAIGLAYYSARKDYRLIRELPTGHGFADAVFLPLPHTYNPAIVMELKYGKPVQTAIQQIKGRQYMPALQGYSGEILLVGISYDKTNTGKKHRCLIERIRKTMK